MHASSHTRGSCLCPLVACCTVLKGTMQLRCDCPCRVAPGRPRCCLRVMITARRAQAATFCSRLRLLQKSQQLIVAHYAGLHSVWLVKQTHQKPARVAGCSNVKFDVSSVLGLTGCSGQCKLAQLHKHKIQRATHQRAQADDCQVHRSRRCASACAAV